MNCFFFFRNWKAAFSDPYSKMEEESELELSQPLTDEEFSSLYAYLNGNSSSAEPFDGENQNELLRSRSQSVTDPPTPGYPDTADGRVDTPARTVDTVAAVAVAVAAVRPAALSTSRCRSA